MKNLIMWDDDTHIVPEGYVEGAWTCCYMYVQQWWFEPAIKHIKQRFNKVRGL